MNLPKCKLSKTHKEIVRIMVFSTPYLKDGQATSNTKARAPLPGFSGVIWDEWGKKGVRMDTKALKKQMGAAIAMVLVAAVALGSATFAWFATNNSVKATTSSISAQSNAAYMTIQNGATGAHEVDSTSVTTSVDSKALFPATYGEEDGSNPGTWMSGYGTDLGNGKLKGNLFNCKGGNATEGSTEAAIAGDYALEQVYNVSSKGQNLSNILVEEVKGDTDTTQDPSLKKALRVLVTNADGSKWQVYGLNAAGDKFEKKIESADFDSYGNVTAGQDTALKVYLYYEGKDANVTTENLQGNKLTATNAVTITFTATADNK